MEAILWKSQVYLLWHGIVKLTVIALEKTLLISCVAMKT
jgi:uncharacterized membrane protein